MTHENVSSMSLDILRQVHRQCGQIINPQQEYAGVLGSTLIDTGRRFLHERSVVFRSIIDDPGDWRNTEFMYDSIPKTQLDSDLLILGAVRGIFSRLPTVCRVLSETAYSLLSDGRHIVRVLNLGSGPGRDTVWLARRFPNQVHVTCVDKDPEAVCLATRAAKNAGVNGNYICAEGNILALDFAGAFDIAILVGILCPLPTKQCAVLLRRVRKYLAVGGVVVATNVTPRMQEDDPFGDFLIRNFAGWHLHYKTPERLEEMLTPARLKPVSFQTLASKLKCNEVENWYR